MLPWVQSLCAVHKTSWDFWGERERNEHEGPQKFQPEWSIFISEQKKNIIQSHCSLHPPMPYETMDANEELVKNRVFLVAERPRHSLQNLKQNCPPLPTPANQSPPSPPSFFIP